MKLRLVIIMAFAGLLIGAIANLPLSWVAPKFMPKDNIGALEYGGTVWNGYVSEVPGFGPIKIKTSLTKALTGKPFFNMDTRSANLSAKGSAKPGLLSGVTVQGNMTHVGAIDPRFAGLVGDFQMTLTELSFDAACKSAKGTVTTDVLTRNAQKMGWTGPNLSGPVSCEDGAVKMELTGKDAQQSIKAVVRIIPDGTFRADVDVLTNDQRAGSILPIFGFQPKDGGYSLLESGRWL